MITHYLRSKKKRTIPSALAPDCPLKSLVKRIPIRYHNRFKNIRLSPELGVVSQREFSTLGMLASYLGIYCTGRITVALPYASEVVKETRDVTIYTLMSHCKESPNGQELRAILENLPEEMK